MIHLNVNCWKSKLAYRSRLHSDMDILETFNVASIN